MTLFLRIWRFSMGLKWSAAYDKPEPAKPSAPTPTRRAAGFTAPASTTPPTKPGQP